jgi:hypothetical protein
MKDLHQNNNSGKEFTYMDSVIEKSKTRRLPQEVKENKFKNQGKNVPFTLHVYYNSNIKNKCKKN